MAIAAYALALQEQICHLANLPLIVQVKGLEKSPSTRSKQMGMMKIPSKMKTSATVAIIELPMLPLKVFIAPQKERFFIEPNLVSHFLLILSISFLSRATYMT